MIGDGEYSAGATLAMKNHVAIIGGWDNNGDWTHSANVTTTLSDNNERRVFFNSNLDKTALLYGVTITKGKNVNTGSGMYNTSPPQCS